MKKLITIFSILFVFTSVVYSQKYTITPTLKLEYFSVYQTDSTDVQSLENETFYLLFDENKQQYVFIPQGMFYKDSIIQHGDPMLLLSNLSKARHNIKYAVFVDLKNKNTIIKGDISLKEGVYYQEKMPELNWKISDSIRIKGSVVVKKAEADFGGRQWIAWFAPSISYPIGPYKFQGLPGVIVELYDNSGHYRFELTKIQPVKPFSFEINLSQSQKIDKNKFIMDLNKIILNNKLVKLKTKGIKLETEDGKVINTNDMFQKAYNKIQKYNNPIEFPE